MGRKRQSVKQLEEKGKTHLTKAEIEKRKNEENELKKLNFNFQAPSHMEGKARDIFNYIKRNLAELELLASVDKYNLCILSESIASYISITEELKDENFIIEYTNKKGFTNSIPNPKIQIQHKYAEQIRRFSSEFGLTPAARLKIISVNMKEKVDEFENDFG